MARKKMLGEYIAVVSTELVKEKEVPYQHLKITSSDEAGSAIDKIFDLSNRPEEHLIVLCLNVRGQIANASIVSKGSVDTSIAMPREIFRTAILSNTSRIIIAHNHPSGSLDPSEEDRKMTQRMKDSGKLLGINVIDSIIIADGIYKSIMY